MRIFALETNQKKLIAELLTPGEILTLPVRFSIFLFLVRSVIYLFVTLLIAAAAFGFLWLGVPQVIVLPVAGVAWFAFVFFRWLGAFIDWRFDVLLITTERVIVVQQYSLFRREIRAMNLENLASVSVVTQFWNLFPFGQLCFDLKEGVGRRLCLSYIPDVDRVAKIVSDALVDYERRDDTVKP